MKKIWGYLRAHWREDFSLKTYSLVAIFLTVLVVVNYKIDFEDSVLDVQTGLKKFIYYFLFYSIPYYAVLIINRNPIEKKFWHHPEFFFKTILGLVVLSLDGSLPFLRTLVSNVNPEIYLWTYKVTVNLISLVTIFLPLWIFYFFFDKHLSGFYGLAIKKFDFKPYFVMLLIMLPLLVAATSLPGFLNQYPMYKVSNAHTFLNIPEWVTVLIYELAYGLDFLTVELVFRGFFVIGMIHLTGRKSVLAMAFIYCLLHFGKPAGEAISSIFGGYILGVIAYETKSIWGGVMVHVGIAWLMEAVSYAAKHI